jgi:hypothetical protein
LRSRPLLIGIEVLAIAAGAVLLWLWLDPTIKAPQPSYVWIPALILGVCFFLLILMALAKNNADTTEQETMPELPLPVTQPIVAAIAPIAQRPQALRTATNKPQWKLEQWTSQPFVEVLDEAVMAEVLNDDFVAPDHLVLSVKVME